MLWRWGKNAFCSFVNPLYIPTLPLSVSESCRCSLSWFTPLIIPCSKNSTSNGEPGEVSAAKAEERGGGRKQSPACAAHSDSITGQSKTRPVPLHSQKPSQREREREKGRGRGGWTKQNTERREMRQSESRSCALWHGGDDMWTTSILILF